jgi:hypothetical protein
VGRARGDECEAEISRLGYSEKSVFFSSHDGLMVGWSVGLCFKIQKSHDRAASSRISSPHGTRAHPRRSRRESAPRRDG